MIFYNYLTTLLMMTEVFFSENMFLSKAKKRNYFYMRLFGSYLVLLAFTFTVQLVYTLFSGTNVAYGEPTSSNVSLFKFFFYLFILLISFIALHRIYDVSVFTILMYGSAGYALQHIGANVNFLIQLLPFYSAMSFSNVFVSLIYEIIVFALVFANGYLLFVKGRKIVPGKAERMKTRIFFSLAVILICIGLSRLTRDNLDRGFISVLAESIYAIVSNVFILFILNVLNDNDVMEEKYDIMEEMLHREKQQYLQSKENIELINIKVHDLKHQLHLLKKDNSEERFKEVEKAIRIYDSKYETGNNALDVILTDKSLLCEKNKIILTCACNGNDISFMEETDIYSLFGNALTNAIDSVSMIKEEEKRCISLNVIEKFGVVCIHCENYFIGEIQFKDGLPSSQKDHSWHGFGMKSMQRIAEKYHGTMTATTKGDIFYLDVAIPVNVSQ